MRTTYDNVFFYRTIVDEIVRVRPANSRKKNVTSGELKACWKNVSSMCLFASCRRCCFCFAVVIRLDKHAKTQNQVIGAVFLSLTNPS